MSSSRAPPLVRISFTKRQAMFSGALALCFTLNIFNNHYHLTD